MSIIKVKNIGKRYQLGNQQPYLSLRDTVVDFFKGKKKETTAFWALKDVSFEVEEGETVAIIGRNGAGKSTLLKILSKITPPTTGEVDMRGRVASLLEVGTGFNPELTGRENIFLNGAILGMTKKEIQSKFDQIVEFSEISKFLDTPVKRYSSGMYVRLAFAVAAHLDPEILIVDEVLAVGDAQFQKKCLGKMDEVSKGGRTVLFVSHNMGAVKNLCKRAVLLEQGHVKAIGETEEVLKAYLGETEHNQATIYYPLNEEKKVQINRVSLLNKQGEPSMEIDLAEEFNIQVECEYRENVSKVNRICLTLLDSNGNPVLQTFDVDCNPNYYQKRPAGKYLVTYKFPPGLFNQQVYKIQVDVGIYPKYNENDAKWEYFDRQEDLYVNLFKASHFSKQFFGGGRPGALLIKIPSEVIKL